MNRFRSKSRRRMTGPSRRGLNWLKPSGSAGNYRNVQQTYQETVRNTLIFIPVELVSFLATGADGANKIKVTVKKADQVWRIVLPDFTAPADLFNLVPGDVGRLVRDREKLGQPPQAGARQRQP